MRERVAREIISPTVSDDFLPKWFNKKIAAAPARHYARPKIVGMRSFS